MTGKKKPAEKTKVFFRKGTGVAKALRGVDDVLGRRGQIDLDELRSRHKDAKIAADAYDKKLDAAFRSDGRGDDYETWKKGVDALRKELKAILARIRNQIEQKDIAGRKISADEKVAALIVSGTRSSLKKMAAFLSKAEAQKTPEAKIEVFNNGIQTATRDITQNINNAIKLQKKGKDWQGKDMSGAAKVLTAWSNNGRRVKDPAHIDRELGAVRQVVKGVTDWYKANKP